MANADLFVCAAWAQRVDDERAALEGGGAVGLAAVVEARALRVEAEADRVPLVVHHLEQVGLQLRAGVGAEAGAGAGARGRVGWCGI